MDAGYASKVEARASTCATRSIDMGKARETAFDISRNDENALEYWLSLIPGKLTSLDDDIMYCRRM